MFRLGCNCLPLILLFFTFVILLKFWFIFFLLIFLPVVILSNKQILNNLIKMFKKEPKQFQSKPGMVYKECNYCNTKAERHEKICKNCGRPFE